IAVISSELGAHPLDDGLDPAHPLGHRQLRPPGRSGGGRTLGFRFLRVLAAACLDLVEDFLNPLMTRRATAPGLGVVRYVLDGRQSVAQNDFLDQTGMNTEAMADKRAFLVVFRNGL